MPFLRFLMLLSLVVWVGGIVFFAFVVAPTLFSVLPTRQLAGAVVTRALTSLHWIGIVSAIVFLAASSFLVSSEHGKMARQVCVVLMLALTLASEFGISRRMTVLRAEMGEIDSVAPADPRRVEFNRLHQWSTRLEGGVLLLGLATIFLIARD
jgi:hypothetical protein